MSQITHGSVAVEDGTKAPEEYAPARKVRVEIGFTSEDGDPAIVYRAGDFASAQVDRLLNRKQSVAPSADAPTEDDKPKRTRRTKAEIEAEKAAKTEDPTEVADDDPTTVVDENDEQIDTGAGADEVSDDTGADEVSDDEVDFDAPIEPEDEGDTVTDEELSSAVQKRNGAVKAPLQIRKLIAEYNPGPTKAFQLRQIPQSKRADFLAKLAKITEPDKK